MPLPEPLRSRPFTTAEALAAGVGRGVLDGPSVRRLLPGVHIAASQPPAFSTLVAAARRVLPPDALLTGPSALRSAGIDVGPLYPLHFVTRHPHQLRRRALRVARVRVLPAASDGVVLPAHALVTSGAVLDLVELVAAGDHLLRSGRCSRDELLAHAGAWHGRGAVRARRAAELVRPRVDSPRESELRLYLVLAGLPEPVCNPLLGDGRLPIGRFDLVYVRLRVVLEYEGDQHRTSREQWNRDILRHEQLAAEGWRLVRVTAERMNRPRTVVAQVLRALRDAGYDGPDPEFGADWLALFSPSARQLRRRDAGRSSSRPVERDDAPGTGADSVCNSRSTSSGREKA